MRRLVVKFGGTSLENGELVRKAAKSIKKEIDKGDTQIAVVVSAMGGTTDTLIEGAKESTQGNVSKKDLDAIMAMGEKISAKIFAASLRSLGVDSIPVTTEDPEWPIITDNTAGNSEPDLEKSQKIGKDKIKPLLEKGIVPVICGFIGRDESGTVTTLGRGGSDITAFLVARIIDAKEVILVTDAEGVMSADPRKVENARLLKTINAEELCDLARYGSQIIHHNALRYKAPDIDAKVIHFRHGNLSEEGTIIEGSIPEAEKVNAKLHPEPLAMLTVVGEGMQTTSGILIKVMNPLSNEGINVFGISIGPRSFSLYVTEEMAQSALELIHGALDMSDTMKSATIEKGIAMIVTESEKFIDTPGVIAKLSDSLAEEGINVIEIYSSQASISYFVNWENGEKAFELLKGSIKDLI